MCLEGVTEISLTVIWGQGACYHRWPRFLSFFSWFACITCVSQGSRVCILCGSQKQNVCIPCQCGYTLSPGLPQGPPLRAFFHRPDAGHSCPLFRGPLRTQGLRSSSAHLWAPQEGRGDAATFDFVPFVGDPPERRVYVAVPPTCVGSWTLIGTSLKSAWLQWSPMGQAPWALMWIG